MSNLRLCPTRLLGPLIAGHALLFTACSDAERSSPSSTSDDAALGTPTSESVVADSVDPQTSESASLAPEASHSAHSSGSEPHLYDAGHMPAQVRVPPPNGGLDYQLGGGYSPPDGVRIVSRDRNDTPANGIYNICYVNGFQVQPGEEDDWESDLLLRDEQGDPVIDEDWNEILLDVSTPEKRARIAAVVGDWIRQCAGDGFDAIEIDNLDTYTRSGDRIEENDAVEFMSALSQIAHAEGLAFAQKNAVELVSRRDEMGTDFVVTEECNTWSECDGYIDSYGSQVLMIEYVEADFEVGCTSFGSDYSIVLRDRNLTTPGNDGYAYDGC